MLHRVNRILTMAVLILLSIVLITTSVVSQILAKYTQTRSIKIPLGFKPAYVDINWESLYKERLMRSQWWTDIGQAKNDYNSKFTVTAMENSITSVPNDEGADDNWADDTWPDRSYFSTKMYTITSDTKYEYTFEAKNNREGGYAGVIFAYDIDGHFPYFAFGEFDNGSVDGKNCIYYRKGHSDAGRYSDCVVNENVVSEVVKETDEGYGQYKVVYDGFYVTFYYLDMNGEYVPLGSTIELPKGSKVCVGVYSCFGSKEENADCTVSLQNCVLTAKNYKTVGCLVGENISLVKKFTLKVATFNINGAKDYTEIAAAIEASGADIIALQEVYYKTSDSDWYDQTALIAKSVGYDHFWTFKAMEWNENENRYEKADYEDKNSPKPGYGVAIISRYPLGDLKRVALPSGTVEKRILARVGIVVENEVLQLFVTQLSNSEETGVTSEVREQQFGTVADEIARWDNVILMGDFNTVNTEDLSQFKPIVEKGFSLVNKPDDPIGTYRHTGAPLDNIVHSKIFTASDRDVIDNNASDHYLLYTTLTFDETPPTDDEATLTDDE